MKLLPDRKARPDEHPKDAPAPSRALGEEAFLRQLEYELIRSNRYGRPLSVARVIAQLLPNETTTPEALLAAIDCVESQVRDVDLRPSSARSRYPASVIRFGDSEACLRGGSVMVSDKALNALLDQLAAISRREDQLAFLRDWIDRLTQAWDSDRNAEQRETLGKLGGG